MNIVTVLAVVLTQLDKVLLSKLLPLEQLGYYTVAGTAAAALSIITQAIATAAFPRFASQVVLGDQEGLARNYHEISRLMSFLVACPAFTLVFFSHDILLQWTRSSVIAREVALAMSLLAIGNMLHAMLNVPYQLILASGHTWISIAVNAIAIVVLVPLMIVLIPKWGTAGAATAWLIWNIFGFLAMPWLLHRVVLQGHKADWYFRDTLPFLVTGLVCFSVGAFLAAHVSPGPGLIRLWPLPIAVFGYMAISARWLPQAAIWRQHSTLRRMLARIGSSYQM
jgi:O-antigen/teichoic acid export membrane protein